MQPFPRFAKGDKVDVKLPGVQLGDWECGVVTRVKNYRAGAVYHVELEGDGSVRVCEESDLDLADS